MKIEPGNKEDKPVKTLENLEVGDVVVDDDGYEVEITDKIKLAYKDKNGGVWTPKELQKDSFRPKGQPLVLTKQRIAKEHNVDVKDLIIKE